MRKKKKNIIKLEMAGYGVENIRITTEILINYTEKHILLTQMDMQQRLQGKMNQMIHQETGYKGQEDDTISTMNGTIFSQMESCIPMLTSMDITSTKMGKEDKAQVIRNERREKSISPFFM